MESIHITSISQNTPRDNPPPEPGREFRLIDLGGGPNPPDRHITFDLDGQRQRIAPPDLLSDTTRDELIQQVERAETITVFPLRHIVGLNDTEQDSFLDIIALGEERVRFAIDAESEPMEPLRAVLEYPIEGSDWSEFQQRQRLSIRLADMRVPNTTEGVADQIHQPHQDDDEADPDPQGFENEIHDEVEFIESVSISTHGEAAEAFLEQLYDDPPRDDEEDLESGQTRFPRMLYYRDEFYLYQGDHWRKVPKQNFRAQVGRFVRAEAPDRVNNGFISNVISILKEMTNVDDWDQESPFWISSLERLETHRRQIMPFQNGLLDFDDVLENHHWTLSPHNPRYFSQSVLPYAFDPEAVCPLWEQTLDEVLPRHNEDDHRREILQEFMGLTLARDDTSFEKFLILLGRGGNGKSTILRIWGDLLGAANVSNVPLERMNHEFRPAEMLNKLANISSDMPRVGELQVGRLKEIVSGEPIQINRKYRDPITATITAKLIFSCNEFPQFNDASDGVWRRMIVIPFLEQFTGDQVDRHRGDQLRQELPGILNWAMRGLERLYDQNALTRCVVCQRKLAQHRWGTDHIRQFIDEHVQFGPGYSILTNNLFNAYTEFCQENGWSACEDDREALGRAVHSPDVRGDQEVRRGRRGFEDETGRRPYLYFGLRLRDGIPHGGGQQLNRTNRNGP